MLTVALVVLLLLALIAAGTLALLWRAAVGDNRHKARFIRHLCERIDGYRAELDALSIAPPAACAAPTPDDPSLLPAEIEQWLRERTN